MNEQQCLERMVPPSKARPGAYRRGIIQIHVTRACDRACTNCTQGSQLRGKATFITPEQFEQACISLKGYFGVVGVFGGNPAIHPQFETLCEIMRKHIRKEQRGLWCNNPLGKGKVMRETFDPRVCNLNCHLDQKAFDEFKRDWPESMPFGLDKDSRHSPVFVSMKDLGIPEEERWELISRCDINQNWSASIGVFRGELRAWFCEIAMAQSILKQDDPEYPDTGLRIAAVLRDGHDGPLTAWWQLPMAAYQFQVRQHCHDCGVPLKGYGALACDENGVEQASETWQDIYKPKRKGREVQIVQLRTELGKPLEKTTRYIQNAEK